MSDAGVILDAAEELVHYDLVEVEWRNGLVGHIPAPFFFRGHRGLRFLLHLPRSARRRDHSFFACPYCGARSYFSGPCRNGEFGLTSWGIEYPDKVKAYKERERRKKLRKDIILRRVLGGGELPKTVKRIEYVVAAPRSL